MTEAQTRHFNVTRALGRGLLVYLDGVAQGIPVEATVDALMAVAMSLVVTGDLDEEQLAENWLRACKEAKRKEGK